MNNPALTPFALELSSLMAKTADIEEVVAPRKKRKKAMDKKLAALATAPIKPVAGYSAGPAKVASAGLLGGLATGGVLTAGAYTYGKRKKREGHQLGVKEGEVRAMKRKRDLALLRKTTKVKTASMTKAAYMEKRAAAKHAIGQILEKNAMIKEAAIVLMAKEAFMCELYRIAEETGDWRIRHSLAFQEERLVAEFEKRAFLGGAFKSLLATGRATGAGLRGGWSGMRAAKWGDKLKGIKGGYQAGRGAHYTRRGLMDAPGGGAMAFTRKATTVPAHAGPQMTREFEQAQRIGRRKASQQLKAGGPGSEAFGPVTTAQYARGAGVTPAGMNPAQAAAFKEEVRLQKYVRPGTATKTQKSTRAQSRTARKELRASYKEQALGGGYGVRVAQPGAAANVPAHLSAPTGLSNKAMRRWKASPEGKKVLAERAAWMKTNQGGSKIVDPKQVLNTRASGSAQRIASQRQLAQQARTTKFQPRPKGSPERAGQMETLTKERAARAAGTGPAVRTVGGGGVKPTRVATPTGPAGPPKPQPTVRPKPQPKVDPKSPPPPEGAGPGFLGGETFTKGTMPSWMPQTVSNKWAALTPEQRRLWAIGGMAGAGGLTAGAIAG